MSPSHVAGDQSSGRSAPGQCDSDKARGRITCGLGPMTRPPKVAVAPLPTCLPLAAANSCHGGCGLRPSGM